MIALDMSNRQRTDYTPEEAERVRGVIRTLLADERIKGNMSLLARLLGGPTRKGQFISQHLSGTTQPGTHTVRELATLLGSTTEMVLAGTVDTSVPFRASTAEEPASRVPRPGKGVVENMATAISLRELTKGVRYPSLEAALIFFAHEKDRWKPFTIEAARAGEFEPECKSWTPPQWVEALDELESLRREHASKRAQESQPRHSPHTRPRK